MESNVLTTLLARQGIYNKDGSIYAYELLYRNPDSTDSNVNLPFCGEEATSSVITQLFSSLDINTIIGNKRAFINFTYNHLIQQTPVLLSQDRIVIEVLETVTIDQTLLDNLKQLKQKGYMIALDDFIFNEQTSCLIELADIIKIDVLNQNKQQIQSQLEHIKHFKGKLLAEKIENNSQLMICHELGFDYFQGFFLNRPSPLNGHLVAENRTYLLKLLIEFNDEEITLEQAEKFILQVPKLSYLLLRLANSAYFYRDKKIDSLMQAIKKLGLVQVRNWITLLLLASNNDNYSDLLERTLIRAKMCEYLAGLSGNANINQAYTVGVLSTLDAFFNEPLATLLGKIQLNEILNDAILYQKGPLGKILQLTIDYEKANFTQLEHAPYSEQDLVHSYLEGIKHARSTLDVINSV